MEEKQTRKHLMSNKHCFTYCWRSNRLLLLICVVLSISLFSSCIANNPSPAKSTKSASPPVAEAKVTPFKFETKIETEPNPEPETTPEPESASNPVIEPTAEPEPTVPVTPTAEPTESVVRPQDVCLTAGEGEVQHRNDAAGYCFLLPDSFEVSEDRGLDVSAVGPTLATFGMNRLALILEFSVLGAPEGAGPHNPESWGAYIAEKNSGPDFQPSVEPVVFAGLEGVRVGPLAGLAGGEAVFVRGYDTLYGITVYPDRESYPDYITEIDQLWARIDETMRFFTPVSAGMEYRTEAEVCPQARPDTTAVIDLIGGWCALIPADWREDVDFDFPGRFFGGPDIGEFWPGQPPHANIVIGFGGPVAGITLEERVEGRMNANGRPDLVDRTDTAIGGHPAAVLDTRDGPHPDRVALIQTNDFQYSVLGQPFDAEVFPEAQADLEAAWDLIIVSIQFFEPYQ